MSVPVQYERQVKSILKNVADIRKFTHATAVYLTESTAFLKNIVQTFRGHAKFENELEKYIPKTYS